MILSCKASGRMFQCMQFQVYQSFNSNFHFYLIEYIYLEKSHPQLDSHNNVFLTGQGGENEGKETGRMEDGTNSLWK